MGRKLSVAVEPCAGQLVYDKDSVRFSMRKLPLDEPLNAGAIVNIVRLQPARFVQVFVNWKGVVMIGIRLSMLAAMAAFPSSVSAQVTVPGRTYTPPSRAADVTRSSASNTRQRDYETVILHADGSRTTITDRGDVHIVEGSGRTEQTVGRGVSHHDVVKTHFRPLQGDQILYVDRLESTGARTRIYAPPLFDPRAQANAADTLIQQQQRAQLAANLANQKPDRKAPVDVDHGHGNQGEAAGRGESHHEAHVSGGEVSAHIKPE